MLNLALVGSDVSRSFSPRMHAFILGNFKVKCSYELVSIAPGQFPAQIERLFCFDGFNVTIPYKEKIVPYLRGVRGAAERLGSVNTVFRGIGYNTDGLGFSLMLAAAGWETAGKDALVLGAGGAGKSVIEALICGGANVFAHERDGERLKRFHRSLGKFTPLGEIAPRPFDFIVNCTGVGMHETVGTLPHVAYDDRSIKSVEPLLKECGAAIDLIYEPEKSEFLRVAEGYGKPVLNGEAMLFFQAYYSDCIFSERTPSAEEAQNFYRKYKETV